MLRQKNKKIPATKSRKVKRTLKGGDGADVQELQMLLFNAITDGSVDTVRSLVQHGIPLNTELAVMLAIENGHLNILKYLVEEKQANIDRIGAKQAFLTAVKEGYLNIVRYLVEETNTRLSPFAEEALNHAMEIERADIRASVVNYLRTIFRIRPIHELLDEGYDNPNAETEYFGPDVYSMGNNRDLNRRYFYNVNDVDRNGHIRRAFDTSILEGLRFESDPKNPITNNPWPLRDESRFRQILKVVSTTTNNRNRM